MANAGDKDLALAAARGDQAAFEAIVDSHLSAVYNLACRMIGDGDDAMDITQEVFIKVYQNIARYDPAYRLFSWIYRIAVNECLNRLKQRERIVALTSEIAAAAPDPEQRSIRRESDEHVWAAMSALSPEHRIVLILKHFLGLSYQDISTTLEIPEKTVKSRLYTARQRLKDALLKQGYAR